MSLSDVRHVVILMQENRSFDHYFGTLNGIRGFGDGQALRFPDGGSVFDQPAPWRPEGVLRPFHLDSRRFDTHIDELPHDWDTGHDAINNGAMNRWPAVKGELTMGYFTRADIPYHYALADAFTLCDGYYCSLAGPTSPNRLFLWTGTAGPGRDGTTGPWIDNTPLPSAPVCDWTTYAERLSEAGVAWRVYHNPSLDPDDGNYEDNALEYFAQFHAMDPADQRYRDAMTRHDLDEFQSDCAAGALPTVSWLVAPHKYCEHPESNPADGAQWIDTALQAVFGNPDVWQHTVFLLMYDENDGFFDHAIPPTPPAGTEDEFVDGVPIGLGNRVPLWAISPWSRGGYVNSQVFDHTSVLRFLEVVTGVAEPNISAWRRSVCGDLTSCFDFDTPDYTVPDLPDTAPLVAAARAAASLPAARPPHCAVPTPTLEIGERPHRPLPYRPWADVIIDPAGVHVELRNRGTAGFPFTIYPNTALPFRGTPFAVDAGDRARYEWPITATAGRYDLTVHGPDGFLTRFAGLATDTVDVRADLTATEVVFELVNRGAMSAEFEVAPTKVAAAGDVTEAVRIPVAAGSTSIAMVPIAGQYDLTVSGPGSFRRRYAGTLHADARAKWSPAGGDTAG